MSHHTRPERTIDGPAPVVIRVRAPEAEEIQRDAGGRRFVWRLDAEAGGYFRWFLDPDCRFKVDELTGELVLRGDDDGGDDDPSPAAKPADLRERIRAAKPESQTGPPDPETAKAPVERGSQAVSTNSRKLASREFNSALEFFHSNFFEAEFLRPEIEACGSAEIRFGHQVARLIELAGGRGIVEMLLELGREWLLFTVIQNKVAAYVDRLEALGPEVLKALGADRLPLPPIHAIHGDKGGKT